MGERSAIGWTDATWNPWYGCTKVSPGCAHCYMFRDMLRYGRDPETVTRSKTRFRDPLKWKDGRMVFTCSWSDWFHEDADAWREEAWQVVRDTPRHTYQILTKRPERVAAHLPADWGDGYANVWLGTSVENQRWVGRAEMLVYTVPAIVHFVSAEPLLGAVAFPSDVLARVEWLIAGGESGAEHRECRPEWLRSLRDQCATASVPFFLKQLGGWPDARAHDKAQLDGRTYTDFPVRLSPQTPTDERDEP